MYFDPMLYKAVMMFCSINLFPHGTIDHPCVSYVMECVQHDNDSNIFKAYTRCQYQWTLTKNREMGYCPNPELVKKHTPEILELYKDK